MAKQDFLEFKGKVFPEKGSELDPSSNPTKNTIPKEMAQGNPILKNKLMIISTILGCIKKIKRDTKLLY